MTGWLDDLHGSKRIIESVNGKLLDMYKAALTLGNYSLAEIVGELSTDLEDAKDLLDTSTSRAVDEVYNGAMQGTSNMMSAVLMMCEREGKHMEKLREIQEQEGEL